MSSLVALLLLAAGLGLVIAGAEAFLDGLLASAARLGVFAFAITVACGRNYGPPVHPYRA